MSYRVFVVLGFSSQRTTEMIRSYQVCVHVYMRLCVKKSVLKDRGWQSWVWQHCVSDKVVCERLCVKHAVWQSRVWKSVWETVRERCVCVCTICKDVKLPWHDLVPSSFMMSCKGNSSTWFCSLFFTINRRGHRCDSASCADEVGQMSQWYQRETSLWRTCFCHSNRLSWEPTSRLCHLRCTLGAIWYSTYSILFDLLVRTELQISCMKMSIAFYFECWNLILVFSAIVLGMFVPIDPDGQFLDYFLHRWDPHTLSKRTLIYLYSGLVVDSRDSVLKGSLKMIHSYQVWRIVCDKVVCERECVKDCAWMRLCVRDCVWHSCVWKRVCVCLICVRKIVRDKAVCERFCATKLCDKVEAVEEAEEAAGYTESRTRTPHKAVGKIKDTRWHETCKHTRCAPDLRLEQCVVCAFDVVLWKSLHAPYSESS